METANFEARLTGEQRRVFDSLTGPAEIQAFLDSTTYSAEDANRNPLRVLADRQAHCLDGALFGAAALRRLGYPPLILDMFPEPGADDDHVLALYRENGRWGAVAKSNFTGLRSREAVYRDLRELVMSYFDQFFNVNGMKTLRSYTRPLHLAAYDRLGWMWDDRGVDAIEQRLLRLGRIALIDAAMAARLSPTDPITYRAGMLVVNQAGLYKPKDG